MEGCLIEILFGFCTVFTQNPFFEIHFAFYRTMKNILYIFFSCLINTLIILPAKAEISNLSNPNNCIRNPESPSKITRSIKLKNFDITLDIPANYRVIALTDGSIKIVDNGTYKFIVCSNKEPRNMLYAYEIYYYWLVKKSNETFLYSNVSDKVPGIDNVYIVWKKEPVDEIKLRIKTKKGLIEIEKEVHDYDLRPFDDEYIKLKIQELIDFSKNIKIL